MAAFGKCTPWRIPKPVTVAEEAVTRAGLAAANAEPLAVPWQPPGSGQLQTALTQRIHLLIPH